MTLGSLLGRVSAANRFLIGSAKSIGAVASGPLFDAVGLRLGSFIVAIAGTLVLVPLLGRPRWRLGRMPTSEDLPEPQRVTDAGGPK